MAQSGLPKDLTLWLNHLEVPMLTEITEEIRVAKQRSNSSSNGLGTMNTTIHRSLTLICVTLHNSTPTYLSIICKA